MPPKDNPTNKPPRLTKKARETAREEAQTKLSNRALGLAVDFFYEHMQKKGWEPVTTVTITDKDDKPREIALGDSKEAVLKSLDELDSEDMRLRAFNLLAKKNGYNLTLKSSGAKTAESIARKQSFPGKENNPISDEVRIIVVSSHIDILDRFATRFQELLSADNPNPRALAKDGRQNKITPVIEEWSMKAKALLNKCIKNSVDGFGAEVQFLPREQARMAARISHRFYQVLRMHHDVTQSFKGLPTGQKSFKEHMIELSAQAMTDNEKLLELQGILDKIERSHEMIEDYNRIAGFLNRLGSDEVMREKDREEANALLKTNDDSSQTLDEVSEGGELANGGKKDSKGGEQTKNDKKDSTGSKKKYSPIFKTMKDIMSYRSYMQEKGQKIDLFPLPMIDEASSPADVEAAMMRLATCSQLTHACYINDAQTPFKNMWVKKAREVNAHLKTDKDSSASTDTPIPACAIDCIDHTLDDRHQPQPKVRYQDREKGIGI